MSWHKTWAAKQSGKPVFLVVAVVGFTVSFYGFYKYAYKPWAIRRRMNEAEKYADFIFSKESERD